ncbi:MAG TPA: GNAT family N-acetyltransferase [Amycolatopsis sp.]|uniref:GNAT family N-acetyltransferase n=1 Tax=Amycolatopsis nalaikhensis TaxID=715472 RepID=A0ABY8XRM3_9PSEU|nr:GNAT family N-acetyltransferase [Amycolatopsis sp. 2-2]WIV58166.1 GNAT family N-acetyltransferase [Amycolatopsis sp. 2-2]
MTDEKRVTDNPDESRYEVWVGEKLAGFAEYDRRGDITVFTHTEIDDAFAGQGLGKVLAAGALDDVVARGGTIVPVCPFIAGYLKKHPDYEEHVRWPKG